MRSSYCTCIYLEYASSDAQKLFLVELFDGIGVVVVLQHDLHGHGAGQAQARRRHLETLLHHGRLHLKLAGQSGRGCQLVVQRVSDSRGFTPQGEGAESTGTSPLH